MPVWPPERRPSALLVDLDGTLADSHPALRRCFSDFLAARGVDASDETFASLDGAPLGEIVARLRGLHGLTGSDDELLAEYRDALERAYPTIRPADGAAELVQLAREEGMTLVLVTSAPAALARAFLAANDLTVSFAGVVSGDDGPTKPDPAPFRRAVELAHVSAAYALALEDAPSGVRAARAAGVGVLGVSGDPGRTDALRDAGASLVVRDLVQATAALRTLPAEAAC